MRVAADTEDDEIRVMSEIGAILARLTPDVAERVLHWAVSRYGSAVIKARISGQNLGSRREAQGEFGDFPALFAAAAPQTESEKAIVAGYWFQVRQGQSDLDAVQVNTELRNLGHGLSNVTRA